MNSSPTGTVTFLFTDIEGSTRRWQDDPESMRALLVDHDEILRDVIEKHHGHLFKHTGDGVAAVFPSASDAVDAAVDAQARLVEVLPVRMGLHTGEAELRDGDYFGSTLNRCARLMGIGHGGQVLCSEATAGLVRDRDDLVDLGEHRLRDLTRAERVFQLGGEQFPTLRSIDSVPSNLPTVLTDLVGRSGDVTELSQLVVEDRLVTLTGTGGVGKTRLSLAVAAAVAGEFFDGVWLVELAPVSDAAGIVRATATALGVAATVGIEEAAVVEFLRGRRLVLVLDNCEHLLDGAADLVEAIVADAPEVHVVVTSREPLGVEGEVVRRVRSLGVPEDDTDSVAVDACDAVRMFVARASAADGDFILDAGNRSAVVEICRRLDGIPLAIELAAARVRNMTPAQIAGRLDERFQLLSGARRAQERHRTLQAAVSWSYDLLDLDSQQIFRRLSVFPATFDLRAAESVGGGVDVFDTLVGLVDRSLVQLDRTTGRYRLLETLRQFGAERAVEEREADDIRHCYVDHYLRLVAEVGPAYEDPRGFATAAAVLAAEIDNISAVADLLIDDGRWRDLHDLCVDGRAGLAVIAPVSFVRWLGAAVDAGACADEQERVDDGGWIAYAAQVTGMMEVSARWASESMALAATSTTSPSPWAHWALGLLAMVEGRFSDYLTHLTAAVDAAEHHGRYELLILRATWLSAQLQVHGYEGHDDLIDDVLRENCEHPVCLGAAVLCAASPAVASQRDLIRGQRYLDTTIDPQAAGPVSGAWLSTYKAMALTDLDPHAGIGLAAQAARLSDRVGSSFAMHAAVLTLALLAARIERLDIALRLHAHADAFPEYQAGPGSGWVTAETLAALADAEFSSPVTAHELTRQELFAVIAELESMP